MAAALAFLTAVKRWDDAAVLRLLSRHSRNIDGSTAVLHECAHYENDAAAYWLLLCGADPTLEIEGGWSARNLAVRRVAGVGAFARAPAARLVFPGALPAPGAAARVTAAVQPRCSSSSKRRSCAGRRSGPGCATTATSDGPGARRRASRPSSSGGGARACRRGAPG